MNYFYQRFKDGRCISPGPTITTQESEKEFSPRRDGLTVLLINPPIREWSYPNIEPLGQCYIAGSALVGGHDLRVLDLNAERGGPVDDFEKFNTFNLR